MYQISVLIPVYNVEKEISRCLISLLNNTIADKAEYIIVNDCSTDNSMSVVDDVINQYPQFKKQIIVINNEKNMGIGYVRNVLLNNAKGKYILFVDSDDWVEPTYLESLYSQACLSNADIVQCNFYHEENDGTIIDESTTPLAQSGKECLIDLYQMKIGAYLWVKMIRRNFLHDNNLTFTPGIDMWEDVYFMTKLFMCNPKTSNVNQSLYHYVMTKNSYLRSIFSIKKADNIFLAISKIEEFLSNNNYEIEMNYFLQRKAGIKRDCLLKGSKKTIKKYIYLYPEIDKYIKLYYQPGIKKINKIHKFIFSFIEKSPKTTYTLLMLFNTIKILLKRIDYKSFME